MDIPAQIAWVRKLIEDTPLARVEQMVAPGGTPEFYVERPPMIDGTVSVLLNGADQVLGADYTVEDAGRTIRFSAAPPADAMVTVKYSRQRFSDDDLKVFLDASDAAAETDAARVYGASVAAIDTLLLGAATALDFGAGAETFGMSSVFNRLMQLRSLYESRMDDENGMGLDGGLGYIRIEDVTF